MKRSKYIFEFLVILISAIGFNLNKIAPKLNGFAIIVACVFLLIWFSIVVTSEDKLKFIKFGNTLILIRIVTPIFAILSTIVFYKFIYEPPKEEKIITFKQKVYSNQCSSIRYGHFKNLDDSIFRFQVDSTDYEVYNKIDTFEVVWIDSCSYRIQKHGGFFEIFRILEISNNYITLERMKNDLKKEIIIQEKIE